MVISYPIYFLIGKKIKRLFCCIISIPPISPAKRPAIFGSIISVRSSLFGSIVNIYRRRRRGPGAQGGAARGGGAGDHPATGLGRVHPGHGRGRSRHNGGRPAAPGVGWHSRPASANRWRERRRLQQREEGG